VCAECISDGKEAVEITEEIDAGLAVDGNVNTHSCTTDARSLPWWSVNLGAEYGILKVSVTLPNDGGGDTCNYCTTFLCFAFRFSPLSNSLRLHCRNHTIGRL